MQLFNADTTIFKKKNAHENMKKMLSKVAHNQPQSKKKLLLYKATF